MVERLEIKRLGRRGDGIADTPAGPLYVPYTLPGETAEVDAWPGHPDRRRLVRVDVASPERIAPICPHFGTCGGCALQHWDAARYRDWKRGLVLEALAWASIDAPVDDVIDAHGEGRRRAVFHARRGQRDVLEVGFAALRAHQLVAIDRCPVLAPSLDQAIAAAWAVAEVLEPTRKPLDIQVTASEAGLDIDVRGSGPLPPARVAELARIAERLKLARLTRHGELVAQRAPPTLSIGRARVTLPPGCFLQATAAGEAALAALIVEGAAKPSRSPICSRVSVPSRCGLPSACASPRSTAIKPRSRRSSARPRRRQGSSRSRPRSRDLFRRPLIAAELKRYRLRGVRSAAAGCRGAGARARSFGRAGHRRSLMQSDDVRARRPHSGRRRLPADARHAGRSVSLFISRRAGGSLRAVLTG